MNTLKQTLFTNWHLMRWLRLLLGTVMASEALMRWDALSGMIAAFFLYQALTNTGCCGTDGCAMPASNADVHEIKEVSYEEIKKS